ncbi:hypothetical protein PMF13cell1_03547 [Blautia producta]|uniref:Uncharacterized protein n=1 Tax=Blautia producta TaxID=33035 RepID=A0A4P6LZ39_9FIRM|nr:hypothetical protein [Blautia producta]QBE97984.1 hypothetical protein PMF13cell1_03547 [Blautia producta]
MLKKLQQGQKLLVLRYGKQIVENCIELHKDIVEEIGYCWFGKLGTVPSKKSIDAVFAETNPYIILYTRGEAFLCGVSEVTYGEPDIGYPGYYKSELFDKLSFPTIYFKLESIESLDVNELEKFTVISSGNSAISTLLHSMSSFLYISYGKIEKSKTESEEKKRIKTKKILSENDCVYKRDGRCGLKSFVNYQYECDRPSTCMRQKR